MLGRPAGAGQVHGAAAQSAVQGSDTTATQATDAGIAGSNSMITVTERGWPAHFCCCHDCIYHRNTLLTYDDGRMIIVSTIGNRRDHRDGLKMVMVDEFRKVWYETKIFVACKKGSHIDPIINLRLFLWNQNAENEFQVEAEKSEDLPDDIDNAVDAAHDAIVGKVISRFNQLLPVQKT